MELLRVSGVVLGSVCLCLVWLVRFRARRLRNFDWLIGSALSLALILLGLFPDTFNWLLASFSFEKGGGGRLMGLLIFSNLISYLLVYLALTRSNKTEAMLDGLVRALAKRDFKERDAAGDAPIYVVIPAYNEAENIGSVLSQIPDEVLGLKTKTLVIVDGATDNTTQVVTALNRAAVSYIINRGGGSALKAGYELALEAGAEIVVTLDADGQHLPQEIAVLVQPILADEADLVNGSRVLGSYEKDSHIRAAGVVFFNWLVSLLTMTRITDCSNSFRAIRASELARLDLRQSQFHTSELLIDAIKKGMRVKEAPISIKRRLHGESKKPPSVWYSWGFMKAILFTWLR
jgi:hypothetical protein